MSKLNPKQDRLLQQRAKAGGLAALSSSDYVWYINSPLSNNLIDKIMRNLSMAATLSLMSPKLLPMIVALRKALTLQGQIVPPQRLLR